MKKSSTSLLAALFATAFVHPNLAAEESRDAQELSVSAVPEAVLEYVDRVWRVPRSSLLFSRRPAEGALQVYRVVVSLEVQGVPDNERVFEILYDPERRAVTAERSIRLL